MKAKIIVSLLIMISLTTVCKKGSSNDPLTIMNLSVSDCKNKGVSEKGVDSEYITIRTVNDSYLGINHISSIFNCQPGEITMTINASGNEISLDENESSHSVNCVCPYDIYFTLGPLRYGTYILKFQKGGQTFKEYTIDFQKSSDIKIDL
jgi:hypothetical protein